MRYGRGWIALVVLALLTPLGIIAIGSAWGEWGLESIRERVGFTPEGMSEAQEKRPEAPFPDYEVPGLAGGGWRSGAGTILSALIGAAFTAVVAIGIARLVKYGRIP
jgi:hypothetical protein